jgi:tetratricopeptide (TPR) repeat protein
MVKLGAGLDYYGPMISFPRLPQRLLRALLALGLMFQVSVHAAQAAAPVQSESSILDAPLLYELLLGELSVQSGEPGTGFSLVLDAARKTGDPRLFQRAVDIAMQARSGESALQAARAWKQAQPFSREANRTTLQILIELNRLTETIDPLKRELLLSDAPQRPAAIASIPRYFSRASDKRQAAAVVEQALADYLATPVTAEASWTTIGRLRFEAGDLTGAQEAAANGQTAQPRAEGPALLALALMGPKLPRAEAMVRKYLDSGATVRPEFRMAYARALLDLQRFAETSAQIDIVTNEKPDYAEAWLIKGSLEMQDNRLAAAEKSLLRFVELMEAKNAESPEEQERVMSQAYLSLAQIAEQRKDYIEAENWLKKITNVEDLVRAQSRRASILARQGKISQARELIQNLPERSPEDARMKLAAEVQLLRDNKKYQSAYELLAQNNQRNPKDFDLLYDQATLAEKLGRMEEMERLLRRIIAEKPEFHHAYNALGYSLADRNVRLSEARALILKALEFAPDDPFISDSLGWVEFRSGNKSQALQILQTAYKARPDAEIAAHLGEVLWNLGQREQALAIWREGMKLNADNETLAQTLKRLRVKL